jgi:hypothetical protein
MLSAFSKNTSSQDTTITKSSSTASSKF